MYGRKSAIKHIADPVLDTVLIKECHETLINLKEQQIVAYGPPPDTPLTKNDYTKMRKSVYDKICTAQKDLPKGWRFRVYEALRSLKVQKYLFNEQYKTLKRQHSNQTEQLIFNKTSRLISPVTHFDGKANIPPHSTGGAVDIEIIDINGHVIDMGMAAKDWLQVEPDICDTYSLQISISAKQNRALLIRVMEDQGFVNYFREWWHFSYGDRLWAYLKDKPYAIYDRIID